MVSGARTHLFLNPVKSSLSSTNQAPRNFTDATVGDATPPTPPPASEVFVSDEDQESATDLTQRKRRNSSARSQPPKKRVPVAVQDGEFEEETTYTIEKGTSSANLL